MPLTFAAPNLRLLFVLALVLTVPNTGLAQMADDEATSKESASHEDATDEGSDAARTETGAKSKKQKKALRQSSPAAGRNALGLSAGLSSGMGLSYRRYLSNIIALRLDGGLIATSSSTLYSVGLTVQQDILRTDYLRFYGLEAFAIHGGQKATPLIVPGAGLGMEYDFNGMRRGFGVRAELVLSSLIRPQEGVSLVTFLPQAGIFFVF